MRPCGCLRLLVKPILTGTLRSCGENHLAQTVSNRSPSLHPVHTVGFVESDRRKKRRPAARDRGWSVWGLGRRLQTWSDGILKGKCCTFGSETCTCCSRLALSAGAGSSAQLPECPAKRPDAGAPRIAAQLGHALHAAMIIVYAQGMAVLAAASDSINITSISRRWRESGGAAA